MKQDLFEYLPSEIVINILSRLPVRSIVMSKCVCKSWLDLLVTDDFVNSHCAKSAPCLAVLMKEGESNLCKVFEFEDDDVDRRHYNPITKVDIDFPHRARAAKIEGSANGLLFLHLINVNVDAVFISNLITREYIELHYSYHPYYLVGVHSFGFGTSKMSGEHKVVRIFRLRGNIYGVKCHVYTLGTGSWRSVKADASLNYSFLSFGAFLNGNLHWLASCSNNTRICVSCFDLETECFSTFFVPHPLEEGGGGGGILGFLYVLNGRLCMSEDTFEDAINIWVMNECGAEKSWSKDYVIGSGPDFDSEGYFDICPIKVFKDGDMLLLWDNQYLYYYSNKTKTILEIGISDAPGCISSMLFAPSFRSLKSFGMENVISF